MNDSKKAIKYDEIEKVVIRFKCELFEAPKTFLRMIYNIVFDDNKMEKKVPFWKCANCGWTIKPLELFEIDDAYCPRCGHDGFVEYDPLNEPDPPNPLDKWMK